MRTVYVYFLTDNGAGGMMLDMQISLVLLFTPSDIHAHINIKTEFSFLIYILA